MDKFFYVLTFTLILLSCIYFIINMLCVTLYDLLIINVIQIKFFHFLIRTNKLSISLTHETHFLWQWIDLDFQNILYKKVIARLV